MTHWFDRLSVRASSTDAGISRREAFARAGAATLALSTVGLRAAPARATPPRLRMAHTAKSSACEGCIQNARASYRNAAHFAAEQFYKLGNIPTQGPAVFLFLGGWVSAEIIYRNELGKCANGLCNPAAMEPQPSVPPNPNNPQENGGCPSGTSPCAGPLCCYGDDLCCGTGTGNPICCIKDVGCTCDG
jgi:hypothetical protein